MGIAERIAHHERELARLRALLQLVAVIRLEVGPGVIFSAADLVRHGTVSNDLRDALAEAGIRNPKQLGKQLHQLVGCGIERADEVRCGVLWCVAL